MNILVLGNMSDLQTGVYIVNSLVELNNNVQHIDTRTIVESKGIVEGQKNIREIIDEIKDMPELIIILKGLEMTPNTIDYIKEKFKNSILVNWFFDVYLDNRKIWENSNYVDTLRKYDYFFCSLKGVADILNEKGFTNVKFLPEACYPEGNEEQYMNNFQKKKYGEDISFCGTLGISNMHTKRINILKRVADEGFHLSIYGSIVGEPKHIPKILRDCHTGQSVINEQHSMVAQSSLINLGIDQDPELSLSQSARMYRVMCAGGLYLTTYVKDLETMFRINAKDVPITKDQDLVVYYNENDLIEKLDFLLAHDNIRESISKNGQKLVKEKHKFTDRINEMMRLIENETK